MADVPRPWVQGAAVVAASGGGGGGGAGGGAGAASVPTTPKTPVSKADLSVIGKPSPGLNFQVTQGVLDADRLRAADASYASIVVVGGVHDSVLVERNEVYDHSTDTWSPLASLPRGPRYAASMVALGTTILLCGGNDGRVALQSCMALCPPMPGQTQRTWTAMAPFPTARCFAAAALLGGNLVLSGGLNTAKTVIGVAESYNFVSGNWTKLPDMPTARCNCAAVTLNNRLLVLGGQGTNGSPVDVVEEYDVASGSWKLLTRLPSCRSGVAAVALGGSVVVAGGFDGSQCVRLVEVYSTLTNTWVALPPLPTPRMGCTAIAVQGHIVVVGGSDAQNKSLACVEAFDERTRTWKSLRPLSVPRQYAAVCAV